MKRLNLKRINKKVLFFMPLLIVILLISFFCMPIKDGRSLYSNIQYNKKVAAAIQPDNYDKMKISYAKIVERKTGTPNFNTTTGESIDDGSVVSNMDGIDVSEKDNYVRTFDTIQYMVEVGVTLNLEHPDVTETTQLNGGVIKVKITLPSNESTPTLFDIKKEAWMGNTAKVNKNERTITAEYIVPNGETIVGGNQQLSFSIDVLGYSKEVATSEKPIFEIWMEGNKPDNNNSKVASHVITDNNQLIITGKTSYNFRLFKGNIDNRGTRNNKRGQYINFIPALELYTSNYSKYHNKGVAFPNLNEIFTKLRINYYYRDINSNGDFIKYGSQKLNEINLVAYNINSDEIKNEDAWPSETSNYRRYISANGRNTYYLYGTYSDTNYSLFGNFNSGDINASYNNGVISTTNVNFSNTYFSSPNDEFCNHLGKSFFYNAIELFIPFEDSVGNYDYRVTIELEDFGSHTDSFYEDEVLSDNSINYSFNDYLTGNYDAELKTYGNLYWNNSSSTETGYVFVNSNVEMYSTLEAKDGPYEGGERRLINFDSSKLRLTKKNNSYYSFFEEKYSYPYSTPKENQTMKYGIYKNNPQVGLNTNKLVNSASIGDFDWYNTVEEALQHGIITSLLWDNPDYDGYGKVEKVYFYLEPVQKEENYNSVAILREKNWLYEDKERKTVHELYTSNEDEYYKPTEYNDNVVYTFTGTPYKAGDSIHINKGYISVNSNYKFDKDIYNVLDEKIYVTIDLNRGSEYGIVDYDTDTVNLQLEIESPYVTYIEGSANYEPVVSQGSRITTLTWRIEDLNLNEPLPTVHFSLSIDPMTPNGTKAYFNARRTHVDRFTTFGFNAGVLYSKEIINLSGSSTRKTSSKEIIETNDNFNITGNVYNISDDALNNVKTIELLPKNNDSRNSIIHGSYTAKITNADEGVTIYYSTRNINDIGIEKDSLGYNTIQNVNLETNPNWQKVNVGETIPANATAIATLTDTILSKTKKGFTYQVIPTGNKPGDIYYFGQYASSDNLAENIFSTYKSVSVVERKISGTVFNDLNRDNVFNSSDTKEKNYKVELLNESGNKIDETLTNSNGYYELTAPNKGKYYIKFANLPFGYELLPKGTTDNHSKANANMVTDLIDHTRIAQNTIEKIENINLGIRKKQATLTIKHLDKITGNSISNKIDKTVYYTDTYETNEASDIPSKYQLDSTSGDPATGTVDKDNIEVIYYYKLRDATLKVRYVDQNGNDIDPSKNRNETVHWGESYTSEQLSFKNYRFTGMSEDSDLANGTIEKDSVTVIYKYELKPSTLIVKYVDQNGNNIDSSKNRNESVHWGDSYTSEQLTFNNYRFTSMSEDSDLANGTIEKDSVTVIYKYELKPSTITVHHYAIGTTTSIAPDKTYDKKYTEEYSTEPTNTTDLYYEYANEHDGDATSGTVNKDSYVINYYYKLKKGKVITHHYLYDGKETTTKLAPDEEKAYDYTSTYNTDVSSKVTSNYELYSKTDNYTGTIKSPLIEVSYFYQLKDSSLESNISITGPEEITDKNKNVDYQIKYEASIVEYIGNGKVVITNTLPYEIDVDKSNLDGGTYNKNNKTITWIENYSNINSYEEENKTQNITIKKDISLRYVGIVGRDRLMISNVKGDITLSNNSRTTTDSASTNIKIMGKIIVKYLDTNGKELVPNIEKSGLVGEGYISSSSNIEGYDLIERPKLEELEFEEEEQEVKYIYKRKTVQIVTKANDGGNITGDEVVFYGDSSTPDKIVIKAKDGYVIESVVINGEKIDIKPNQQQLVLGQFKEMKEDYLVEVSFKEKTVENPNTAVISISFISILVVIFFVIMVIKKKKIYRI